MEYNEFLEAVQKKRTKKTALVRGSWGVYDALKHIRKHGWYNIGRPVTEHEFYSIIRSVNKLLAESLVHGEDIHFPYGMGVLEVKRVKREVFLNKKGKLVNTYPISWKETLKLWYEDEEAKNNKILIRKECECTYKIFYNKYRATYKNQCFYTFASNRFMERSLFENTKKGKTDTLW